MLVLNADKVSLPEAVSHTRALAAAHGATEEDLDRVSYRRVYGLALDGKLPTTIIRGRRYVRTEHLPVLASLLGVACASNHSAAS
jgi:hypothetical protein